MESFKFWICLIGFLLILDSSPLVCGESESDQDLDEDEGDIQDDGAPDRLPSISSQPQELVLEKGNDFKLDCTADTAQLVLMWSRLKPGSTNPDILYVDIKYTSDPRFEFAEQSLSLKNVTEDDTGKYICQIGVNATLTHTVHVKGPSWVKFDEKKVEASEKEMASLKCRVGGYPVPTVTWIKEGHTFPTDVEVTNVYGFSILTFKHVKGSHRGRYFCNAVNPEGEAFTSIDLVVKHTPEVFTTRDSVHSVEGSDLKLDCNVVAFPEAKVFWLFNGTGSFATLPRTGRYHLHQVNGTYTLTVSKVTEDDFGVFACHATNNIGTKTVRTVLTRAPSQPLLVKSELGKEHMSYNLVWTTESSSPIDEYILRYKKGDGDWTDLKVKGEPDPNKQYGFIVNHTFDKLDSSHYEAQLLARNKFDWSSPSRTNKFIINGNSYQSSVAESAKASGSGGSAGNQLVSSWALSLLSIFFVILKTSFCRWQ